MTTARTGALFLVLSLFILAALAQETQQQQTESYRPPAQTIRRYNLTIAYASAAPDGFVKRVITVNGKMPGPLLWSEVGDRMIVTVTNMLQTEGIAIHWHGLHHRGNPYMDGTTGVTQCAIDPGRTFIYDFITDLPGTYWYHSHSDVQYPEGLVGPLIVYEKSNTFKNQYDEEVIVMLQDWFHIPALDMLTQTMENKYYILPEAPFFGPQIPSTILSSILVNGKGWHFEPLVPNTESGFDETVVQNITQFNVKRGKRYLFRVINAASISPLQFYVTNHSQQIVEVDSIRIKPVNSRNGMTLNVAQRYSFILTANQSVGNYFIPVPLPDVYGAPPFENYFGIAVLHYEGAPTPVLPAPDGPWGAPSPPLPVTPPVDVDQTKALIPLVSTPLPKNGRVDKRFTLVITQKEQMFFINNKTFAMPAGHYMLDRYLRKPIPRDIPYINVDYGDVVELTIHSHAFLEPNSANHPFHLHGHNFWVLGSGIGYQVNTSKLNYQNPMYRDTQIIPIYSNPLNVSDAAPGWMVMRFLADNPGVWHLHCHMEWHLTMGLALLINSGIDRIPPPPPNTPLCGLQYNQVYRN